MIFFHKRSILTNFSHTFIWQVFVFMKISFMLESIFWEVVRLYSTMYCTSLENTAGQKLICVLLIWFIKKVSIKLYWNVLLVSCYYIKNIWFRGLILSFSKCQAWHSWHVCISNIEFTSQEMHFSCSRMMKAKKTLTFCFDYDDFRFPFWSFEDAQFPGQILFHHEILNAVALS